MGIRVKHDVPADLLARLALKTGRALGRAQRRREGAEEARWRRTLDFQRERAAQEDRVRREAMERAAAEAEEQAQRESEKTRKYYDEYLPGVEQRGWDRAHPAPGTPEYEQLEAEQAAQVEGETGRLTALERRKGELEAEKQEGELQRNLKRIGEAEAQGLLTPDEAEYARRAQMVTGKRELPPPPPEGVTAQAFGEETLTRGTTVFGRDSKGAWKKIGDMNTGDLTPADRVRAGEARGKLVTELLTMIMAAEPKVGIATALQRAKGMADEVMGPGPSPQKMGGAVPPELARSVGQPLRPAAGIPGPAPVALPHPAGEGAPPTPSPQGVMLRRQYSEEQIARLKAAARQGSPVAQQALEMMGEPWQQ